MKDNISKSILYLDSMVFDEIQYKREFDGEIAPEYEMNFQRIVNETEDNIHYKVTLIANIWSKNKTISLRVSLTGFFSCECEDENMKEMLIRENTVAILFPYIRSQVSLVSTQPYMLPIVIPPVNIVSMFENTNGETE